MAHRAIFYEYKEFGAPFAAESIGEPLEIVCKSLIVTAGDKQFWAVVLQGDQELSLKNLARHLGVKTMSMASARDVERITGYQPGGVSPILTRREVPVILEETLQLLDRVIVNAGRRGALVELSPDDLRDVTSADWVDVLA